MIGPKEWEPAFSPAHEQTLWLSLVECDVNHGYYGLWLCWYPSEDVSCGPVVDSPENIKLRQERSLCSCFCHNYSDISLLVAGSLTEQWPSERIRKATPEKVSTLPLLHFLCPRRASMSSIHIILLVLCDFKAVSSSAQRNIKQNKTEGVFRKAEVHSSVRLTYRHTMRHQLQFSQLVRPRSPWSSSGWSASCWAFRSCVNQLSNLVKMY